MNRTQMLSYAQDLLYTCWDDIDSTKESVPCTKGPRLGVDAQDHAALHIEIDRMLLHTIREMPTLWRTEDEPDLSHRRSGDLLLNEENIPHMILLRATTTALDILRRIQQEIIEDALRMTL